MTWLLYCAGAATVPSTLFLSIFPSLPIPSLLLSLSLLLQLGVCGRSVAKRILMHFSSKLSHFAKLQLLMMLATLYQLTRTSECSFTNPTVIKISKHEFSDISQLTVVESPPRRNMEAVDASDQHKQQ